MIFKVKSEREYGMSIANAQLTVFMLTSYKSTLASKLMGISNERIMLSTLKQAKMQQLSNAQTSQITALREQAEAALESGSTADYDKIMEYIEQLTSIKLDTTDSDVTLQTIALKDNELDIKQKALETKLAAVTDNLESQEKLLENNIKEDFSTLGS